MTPIASGKPFDAACASNIREKPHAMSHALRNLTHAFNCTSFFVALNYETHATALAVFLEYFSDAYKFKYFAFESFKIDHAQWQLSSRKASVL